MEIIVSTTHLRTMSEESSSTSPCESKRPLNEAQPPAVSLPSLAGNSIGNNNIHSSNNNNNKLNHQAKNKDETNNATILLNLETKNHRPLSGGFIASWHTASDMTERRLILKEIVRRIHRRRPNAPSSMKKQLPMMAKKMEEALYKEAPSKEVYADLSTLEYRMEDLARKVQVQVETMKQKTAKLPSKH